MNGITTYPFNIMGNGWEKVTPKLSDLPIKGDTIIGNDVQIGENVTILPGVQIGDGAIIGANCVVAKNVEPYSIVVGNPSKLVRKRFNDDIINKLLELKWWDWDEKRIFSNLEALTSGQLNDLV